MILIVTANTMAQSIRERTSELARAEDARLRRRPHAGAWCCWSRACSRWSAAWPGLAVVVGAHRAGAIRPAAFLPTFYFPVRDLIAGVALVLLLGLAAGALPAWQAGACASSTR